MWPAPTSNTATAALNGISYGATDPIEWTATVIRGSVTLDDDQNPGLPPTIADGGTWKYTEHTPARRIRPLYEGDDTHYTFSESNTATVTPLANSLTTARLHIGGLLRPDHQQGRQWQVR